MSPTACNCPALKAARGGGQPEFIEPLARAGVAAGADGLFCEVHDAPATAKSDGANALRLELLPALLERLRNCAD